MKFSSLVLLFFVALLSIACASFSSFAAVNDEQVSSTQEKNRINVSSSSANVLRNTDPLPINARILSLLNLLEKEPQASKEKAKEILLQLEDISATFNAGEQYLMLFIHGLIERADHNDKQAITWLEKTLDLRDEIPKKQLYLPEFARVNVTLAQSYAALGDFKQAFDYKKKYIRNGYQYFAQTKAEKIAELNETYATDHKIKQNELLANQNKIKRLKIVDAENKQFAQQRNVVLLFVAVICFFVLLLRQMKIQKQLKYLAKTDSLTGLYNRKTLFEQGTIAIETAVNEKHALSVILLDIDFFKNVNDTYGHDVGDDAIKSIAKLGSETMRSRDVFARLGGEEFVGILPGVGCAEAKAIAERLREKVASIDLSELKIEQQLTVSIGVACLEQVPPSFDELLNAADLAMYSAKASGRNRVCLYSEPRNNTD
jgi:diguanylate cyclase (GGDEF)-like protein